LLRKQQVILGGYFFAAPGMLFVTANPCISRVCCLSLLWPVAKRWNDR